MPRILLVMRHAKSSWQDDRVPDHDRPLTKRGKRAARRIGEELRARHVTPDIVLSSTAKRALRTVRQFSKGNRYENGILSDRNLYLGEIPEHLHALRQLPNKAHTVLLVGHNPTLEDLVALLTGQAVPLPTATVVCILLPIDRWDQIDERTRGSLSFTLAPKELAVRGTHQGKAAHST